ncbi:MAG: hypothetical protein RSF90_04115, partial [Pygmaiobacter sp.]
GLVLGTLAGQLAALIPARLHAKHGINVTLASAILNFFILEVTSYLLVTFMADPAAGEVASFSIPTRVRLPLLFPTIGVRVGTLIALATALIAYYVLYRTKRGYEIRTVGTSEGLAAYLGLSSAGIILFSQTFAGAMAGLGGAVQMMGISPRYAWNGVFSNIGFAGILVALLANCNPGWVPLAALLFGYLNTGGLFLKQTMGIPSELSAIAEVLILLVLYALRYAQKQKKTGRRTFLQLRDTPTSPRPEQRKDGSKLEQ